MKLVVITSTPFPGYRWFNRTKSKASVCARLTLTLCWSVLCTFVYFACIFMFWIFSNTEYSLLTLFYWDLLVCPISPGKTKRYKAMTMQNNAVKTKFSSSLLSRKWKRGSVTQPFSSFKYLFNAMFCYVILERT